jgi:2-iminoacetate synthase ThiH
MPAVSFAAVARKIRAGEPLAHADGLVLFTHPSLLEVGALANEVRERLHGERTYWNRNLHINPTNVCVSACKLCSFSRRAASDAGAFVLGIDEAVAKLRARLDAGEPVTEAHIVGGLHDGLPLDYFTGLLAALKAAAPHITLKAFSAVEIFFFHRLYGLSVAEVLPFHPENNALGDKPAPTAAESLRTLAVSRLLLGNVPHIKAYWVSLGLATAQTALWFGADDFDGTVSEEKIYHQAGARTPQALAPAEIARIIRAAGRQPVERDTLYGLASEEAV